MWSQQRGVQDHNPAAECQSQNGRLLPGGGNAKISPPKPPNYPSGQAICYKFHSVGCTSNTCGRDHGAPVAQVRASYLEDVEEGRAFGPMTEAQAEQMCGGPLVHGALGAVEEFNCLPTGEKVREKHLTIHDGTAVGVNPRIQRNLMGRTTLPSVHEALHIMKMSQKSAQSRLDMFGLDVRSAHRQCLLDHKELRFATARLAEDEVYVNAVCTYGIASAQWWWGSQGAALHRIILHFSEGDFEVYGLLFVDDWLWLLPVLRYWPGITVILVITMMLGTPVKWSKVTAGVQGT